MIQHSIKALFRVLFVTVFITVTGVVAFTVWATVVRETTTAQARATDVTLLTALDMRRFLSDARSVLKVLAEGGPKVLAEGKPCEAWLGPGAGLLPQFSNASLLARDGTVVCTSFPEGPRGVTYGDREWFRRVMTSGSFITSDPTIGRRTGLWSLALALPVETGGGERIGAAVLGLELSRLQERIALPHLPKGSVVTITRDSTVILARSRDPELWIGREVRGPVVPRVTLGEGVWVTRATTQEGERAFFTATDLPDFGWRVYVGVPERAIYGPAWDAALRAGGLGGVGLMALGLLLLFGYRRIDTALTELANATAAAVRCRRPSIEVSGPQEVRTIASQFQGALTAWAAAEERNAQLFKAVSQTADSVLVTDVNGRIEYVNPAFEAMTGYALPEVLGKTPAVLRSGAHSKNFYEVLWGTILSGSTFRGRLTNRSKQGRLLIIEQTITPVHGADGRITHFVATGRDVTEQEELEQRLRQAEKLEAVGQLAGGIAHDFNNILTAIQGYAQLLDFRIEEGDRAKVQECVMEIVKGTEMAASLTRQLLAFSRKGTVQPQALSLNAVVTKVESFLRRVFPADRYVEIRLDPSAGTVVMDPAHLEQVILNLALNARDALGEGGTLTIATGREPGRNAGDKSEMDSGWAVLTVADDGPGVPPDVVHRIFEPFFTTKKEGTGLGLATVRDVVKRAGGTVVLDNRPGEGATFIVRLPRLPDEDQTSAPGILSPSATVAGGTVVLAEDTDSVGRFVAEVLSTHGYTVHWSRDGIRALDMAVEAARSENGLTAVVSDVVLPGLRGPALLERLREEVGAVPAVLISGYAGESLPDVAKQIETGVAFLQKPFTAQALLATLSAAIRHEKG